MARVLKRLTLQAALPMPMPIRSNPAYIGEYAGHVEVRINADADLECTCGAVADTQEELQEIYCRTA